MKKLFLLLFLPVFLHSSSLQADLNRNSQMCYVKVGAGYFTKGIYLPNFGLGVRFQREEHGCDLSFSFGSLVFENYASLKGMYLFYPKLQDKNQLYLGFGSGVGYYLSSVPMGMPYGSVTKSYASLNLEAVLGYEFNVNCYFKPFIQLELSQPIFNFSRSKYRVRDGDDYKNRYVRCDNTPKIALMFGFGLNLP